jgi:hypothetical protein
VLYPIFIRAWAIREPEPLLNPITFPELGVVVQVNVAPGTLEVRIIFVVPPLHIEADNGVVVRLGIGFTVTL